MPSPIINYTGTGFTNGLGVGQDFLYVSNVSALRGANGLDGVTTVGLNLKTLVLITINEQFSAWLLESGPADATNPDQEVAPLDYNAGTNNVHWQSAADFKEGLVGTLLTKATGQSIPGGIDYAFPFDTIRSTTGEFTTTSPTRITIVTPGVYAVHGSVSFAPNTFGYRNIYIRKNGGGYINADIRPANQSGSTVLTTGTLVYLTTGDYIELVVRQTSVGSLNVDKVADYSPEFGAVWMGNPTAQALNGGGTVGFGGTGGGGSPEPATSTQDFNAGDVGWYRFYVGGTSDVGEFTLRRLAQSDGSVLDADISFGIFGAPSTGIIQVPRNAMSPALPGMDCVRVSYDTAGYVDVHLILAGSWQWEHPIGDGYVDAPYLVDSAGTTDQKTLTISPNTVATTETIDIAQATFGGRKIATSSTSGWVAPTGTVSRDTFDTGSATLNQVAQRLAALEIDLLAYGAIWAGLPATILYTDMLSLADSVVGENTVANISDIFRITAAPDTSVQGIYVPKGTANGKTLYALQGYEWNSADTYEVKYSGTVWQIYNSSGLIYQSSAPATPASPWLVTQWQNLTPANVTVTTVAPSIALTYNKLTENHSGCYVLNVGGDSTWNGVYRYTDTLNGKRRYYLYGDQGVDNKRIYWDGTEWKIGSDSVDHEYGSFENTSFPDQVVSWPFGSGIGSPLVVRMDAVDLASGCTVTGGGTDTDGIYFPEVGVYSLHNQVYRRIDGLRYINQSGTSSGWFITDGAGTFGSIFADTGSTGAKYPWEASWVASGLIVQEKKVAGPLNWHI